MIPKTPFKLNDNDLIYDVDVQKTGQIIGVKAIYPNCDIKNCGGSAFYVAGFKRKYDDGRVYAQNLCERHLKEAIERLGIKES